MFGGNSETVCEVCDGEEFGEQAKYKRPRIGGFLVVVGILEEELFMACLYI